MVITSKSLDITTTTGTVLVVYQLKTGTAPPSYHESARFSCRKAGFFTWFGYPQAI